MQPVRSARKTGALTMALALWLLVGAASGFRGEALVPTRAAEDDLTIGVSDIVRSNPMPPSVPTPSITPAAIPSPVADAPPELEPRTASSSTAGPPPAPSAPAWSRVTTSDFAQVAFERLPADACLVAPIAPSGEAPETVVAERLQTIGVYAFKFLGRLTGDLH